MVYIPDVYVSFQSKTNNILNFMVQFPSRKKQYEYVAKEYRLHQYRVCNLVLAVVREFGEIKYISNEIDDYFLVNDYGYSIPKNNRDKTIITYCDTILHDHLFYVTSIITHLKPEYEPYLKIYHVSENEHKWDSELYTILQSHMNHITTNE